MEGVGVWVSPSSAQGLFPALCSEVSAGGSWGPYAVPDTKPVSVGCKAKAMVPVLSLQPCWPSQKMGLGGEPEATTRKQYDFSFIYSLRLGMIKFQCAYYMTLAYLYWCSIMFIGM